MSGYDSTGASTVNGGNGYANSSAAAQQGSSGGGGGGQKRRRVNADPDFYPGAAPTTKRAQANWRAAQEQAARQNSLQQLSQQQQQQQQLQQQQQQMEPRQPILSLASLPPEALQRYLSRYGLIDPQGLLSYHHAVFPVPALPETLYPPLDGRQLNVRKAKMTYIPAARNAKILAARAAAAAATGGEGGDEATTGDDPVPATGTDETNNSDQAENGTADAVMTPAAATSSADPRATAAASSSSSSSSVPGSRLTPQARSWLEPQTADFASLSAFDHPDVVLQRLAARATQHWDKRESLKEAETLTNFMFSVRNRGRTLRATPAG